MYFVVGPVLALLISLKFTQQQNKKHQLEYEALAAKVELIENRNEAIDKEMLQKIMTTVMPIAKAVNKLNTEVGIG
tara:strand:- start:602 stop:829 length:228 start_codon:yes stop_codon:yes gene_type:complete